MENDCDSVKMELLIGSYTLTRSPRSVQSAVNILNMGYNYYTPCPLPVICLFVMNAVTLQSIKLHVL